MNNWIVVPYTPQGAFEQNDLEAFFCSSPAPLFRFPAGPPGPVGNRGSNRFLLCRTRALFVACVQIESKHVGALFQQFQRPADASQLASHGRLFKVIAGSHE